VSPRWEQLLSLLKSAPKTSDAYTIFGRFQTRVVLFVLKKEKQGHEKDGHKNLDAIMQLWNADYGKVLKGESILAKAESSTAADNTAPKSLSQLQDKSAIACHDFKLKVGTAYQNFGIERAHEDKIFTLASVQANHAEFHHKPLFSAAVESVLVNFTDKDTKNKLRIKEWRPYKGEQPSALTASQVLALLPQHNPQLQAQLLKQQVESSLLTQVLDSKLKDDDLIFCCNPHVVRAGKQAAAGKLNFYLAGSCSPLKPDATLESLTDIKVCMNVADDYNPATLFAITPLKQTLNLKTETFIESNEKVALMPYCWVRPAADEANANYLSLW